MKGGFEMELVKQYVKQHKGSYVFILALAVLAVICNVAAYVVLAKCVKLMIVGVFDTSELLKYAVYIGILLCLKGVFEALSTKVSHSTTFVILKDIRNDLSDKLFKMQLGDILNIQSGKLKNIFVDQVDQMETTLAHLIPEMTSNLIGPLILFIYMFVIDWRLAFVSMIPFIVGMIFMMKVTGDVYKSNYEKSVEITQRMNNTIVEYINGIEVIKSYNQSDRSYKKYHDIVYENANFYYNWMDRCMKAVAIGRELSPMGLLFVIPVGLYLYGNQSISETSLIMCLILSFGTVSHIMKAFNFMDDLSRIGTISNEIQSILDAKELDHGTCMQDIKQYDISFEDVSFGYKEDLNVLNEVSFSIENGTVNAIVGPSGSGKSTIAKLIASMYDYGSGVIRIGGVALKDIPLTQVNEMISYVSQDNYLFDMSILDNIRIAKPDASDEEVIRCAKRAGCHEFISQLENGYNTIVGDAGGSISGGERQRISIARAMMKDAPIVILDEATSYMDPENEMKIQTAISKLVEHKTLIVVAHRLRTVQSCDQIIVVNNGEIDHCGTHDELLKESTLYQFMWEAAMKGEE